MSKIFWHIPQDEMASNETIKALQRSHSDCFQKVCAKDISENKAVASLKSWTIELIDEDKLKELQKLFLETTKLINKFGVEAFFNNKLSESFSLDDCLIDAHASKLTFDNVPKNLAGLSIAYDAKMKPLCLDFENLGYRQRLLRGGRQKEAVARAVMQGLENNALVFDATAGLGRESMILAHAGAQVFSFERQLPIWILLHDALLRANSSRYFPFTLPKLQPLGTIKDFFNKEGALIPDVIYYDPMFPQKERSASIKKEMFVFQKVVGQDEDIEDMLSFAISHAKKRVVVKRPRDATPVEFAAIKCAYNVDGGQCRFDCYEGKA